MSQTQIDPIYKYDVNYHRFAEYLGVDRFKRDRFDLAKKMALLYDWGKFKSKSDEFSDIFKSVAMLQDSMGLRTQGETLVKDLWKWVRLDMDRERLVEEKKAVESSVGERKAKKEISKENFASWLEKHDKEKQSLDKAKRKSEINTDKTMQEQGVARAVEPETINVKVIKDTTPKAEEV